MKNNLDEQQPQQAADQYQFVETPYVETQEEKIEKYARMAAPSVIAVGLGGAGCNVITWVKEKGIAGVYCPF